MRLYKRYIQVIIGNDDNAISIDSLYITFEIKKAISAKPSEGTVSIYNLNDTSESKIQEAGERIRILAGYNGNADLLYDGDIRKIEKNKQKLDRILTVTIGGNVFKLTDAFFNKSYNGAISVSQIVQDAIPTFGLDAIGLEKIPASTLNDFAFTGRTADLLDKILNPLDVQWFEDDGFINFSVRGESTETIFVLKPGTGLVDSPGITDEGIKFKALLNGRIKINGRVKIESRLVKGVYKITQLVYRGDNRDGEFLVECLGTSTNEQ